MIYNLTSTVTVPQIDALRAHLGEVKSIAFRNARNMVVLPVDTKDFIAKDILPELYSTIYEVLLANGILVYYDSKTERYSVSHDLPKYLARQDDALRASLTTPTMTSFFPQDGTYVNLSNHNVTYENGKEELELSTFNSQGSNVIVIPASGLLNIRGILAMEWFDQLLGKVTKGRRVIINNGKTLKNYSKVPVKLVKVIKENCAAVDKYIKQMQVVSEMLPEYTIDLRGNVSEVNPLGEPYVPPEAPETNAFSRPAYGEEVGVADAVDFEVNYSTLPYLDTVRGKQTVIDCTGTLKSNEGFDVFRPGYGPTTPSIIFVPVYDTVTALMDFLQKLYRHDVHLTITPECAIYLLDDDGIFYREENECSIVFIKSAFGNGGGARRRCGGESRR